MKYPNGRARVWSFWPGVLSILGMLGIAPSTSAFSPDNQWQVVGQTPTFATQHQAAQYLRTLTHLSPAYALLTQVTEITQIDDGYEKYRYEGLPISPNTTGWRYFDGYYLPSWVYSEEEWVATRLPKLPHDSRCPATTLTPSSGWITLSTTYGGLSYRDMRNYGYKYYSFSNGNCYEYTSTLRVDRDRTVSCPTNYYGHTSPPGCRLSLVATIQGRRLYCEASGHESGERGNPCNAVTGNKSQAETDYSGPGNLKFVRYYHSRNTDPTHRLGAGWSHNYQATLAPESGGIRYGLIRSNGYRESLHAVGSGYVNYISRAGNGLHLKKINSTTLVAYLSDGSTETYDAAGRLLATKTAAGLTTSLSYHSSGRLTTVTGPFGHTLQLEYNADGQLSRVLDPDGQAIEYAYTAGNLTQVTYPDARTRTYHYEDTSFPNHLTGITDENNVRYATFGYDSSGRAALTEHAGGAQRHTISYSTTSSTVTDPLGTVETINFTTDASLARRITQVSKGGLTRTYTVPSTSSDFQRRISQETDPRGIVTKYAYSTHHLTSKTEAFGTTSARTTSFQYLEDTSDKLTLLTEPGRETAFTYDTAGNVLTKTIRDTATSETRVWTYTYNSFGQALTIDSPRTDVSDVTTYTYYGCTVGYQCGQLETVTNALGQSTTYNTYNAHGQPLTITDPNGVVTTLTYDLRQRLTSRTLGTELTSFEYWPTGLLKKVTLPNSSYLSYSYDGAHRLTSIADDDGNRIEYTLDDMGNRTAESLYDPSNALTQTRTRVFNTLNQLWKEIGAAGTSAVTTTYGYDNNGNPTSINAPLSRNTGQTYDELNRLTQVTDPATGLTQYGYNPLDQLISVTDPRGKITSYTYNALGDLTQQVSPDTGTTVNTYDGAGNLETRTDARGKTGTYTYDALNRVTSLVYPDQTITYTYDVGTNALGRLSSVSDASGSTAWSYDSQGRVTLRQQTMGSVSKSVGYGYNSTGQLQSVTLPSGNVITYGYTSGKVTSLTLNGSTTLLSNVLYQPFGPTLGWTWGNSTLTVREYDTDGKVTDIDSAGLKTYGYDDAFRITGITDTSDPALSQSYGYDLLDRLTSATGTGLNQSWTYDANGNRLTQGGSSSSTYTIATANNRISSISGALTRTYSYDAAGNTTGDGTATYGYDDAGRMVTATKGSTTATYKLNALGQRVRKTIAAGSNYFAYDETGHLTGEYDTAGDLIQETVWFEDVPVAVLKPNGSGGVNVFYIHTDHLNTPRRISRPSDNVVVWRWDSDPFGATAANEDPDGDSSLFVYNLRFPGQSYDAETGLNYNYFRDYDQQIGRYVQSDPIGLGGGINTYAYALNRPISLIDPFGLCSCSGGSWNVDAGDLNLSLAFGGYMSFGAVSFTCKSNPSTKCQAYVSCVGGGAIVGAGATISLKGRVRGVPHSRGLQGWSGWQATSSVGPVAGQADGSSGGGIGAGPSAGAGIAAIKCNTFSLKCQCNCEQ